MVEWLTSMTKELRYLQIHLFMEIVQCWETSSISSTHKTQASLIHCLIPAINSITLEIGILLLTHLSTMPLL
jgi:hypothetical protein